MHAYYFLKMTSTLSAGKQLSSATTMFDYNDNLRQQSNNASGEILAGLLPFVSDNAICRGQVLF